MRWGIPGAPIPAALPFAQLFTSAAAEVNIPPCLPYAIKHNEDPQNDPTVVSGDGGHGLMQLTDTFPADWQDPMANVVYAVRVYIVPAITFWNATMQQTGDALLRCVFAEYNTGRTNALAGHALGDVDRYTTNTYAARALAAFHTLIAGGTP
jgi:hypothetical protein